MPHSIFTPRSMAVAAVVGVAGGSLVAALGDAAWGIAVLIGLATGVLATTIPIHFRRTDAFRWPPGLLGAAPGTERQRATAGFLVVVLINWAVLASLSDWLDPGNHVIRLSFLLMGLALYELGIISGALGRLGDHDTGSSARQAGSSDFDGSRVRVFSGLPLSVGILTGVIVAVTLGHLAGTPSLLAVMTGFVAAACGLAVVVVARNRRLNVLGGVPARRYPGVVALAILVALVPMSAVQIAVFSISLSRIEHDPMLSVSVPLAFLVPLTTVTACLLGGIAGALSQIEDREAGPRVRVLNTVSGLTEGGSTDRD